MGGRKKRGKKSTKLTLTERLAMIDPERDYRSQGPPQQATPPTQGNPPPPLAMINPERQFQSHGPPQQATPPTPGNPPPPLVMINPERQFRSQGPPQQATPPTPRNPPPPLVMINPERQFRSHGPPRQATPPTPGNPPPPLAMMDPERQIRSQAPPRQATPPAPGTPPIKLQRRGRTYIPPENIPFALIGAPYSAYFPLSPHQQQDLQPGPSSSQYHTHSPLRRRPEVFSRPSKFTELGNLDKSECFRGEWLFIQSLLLEGNMAEFWQVCDDFIHRVAEEGETDMVDALLSLGANPNLKKERGWTSLHWAAANGHLEAVKLLLDGGATVDAKCDDGFTPAEYAAHNNHKEIMNILFERMSRLKVDDQNPK